MKPTIAALLGSPVPDGNTALLLNHAIAGAEDAGCEVQTIDVPSLAITACREFNFCRDHSGCMMEDDMRDIYSRFRDYDSMIIATPVMTMGIPGALKVFMDRFQVFYCAKYERKDPLVPVEKRSHRRTLLLSISGMNIPENFDGVRLTTYAFCDVIDCRLADELYVRDMDHKRDLHQFPDILSEAHQKGKKLGEFVMAAVR